MGVGGLKIHPLYIFHAKPHHVAALRAAKAVLDVPFLVQPLEAANGVDGRVLAFGEHPGFMCESFLVASPDDVPVALRWALGLVELDADGYGEKLSRWFRTEVREVVE